MVKQELRETNPQLKKMAVQTSVGLTIMKKWRKSIPATKVLVPDTDDCMCRYHTMDKKD